MTYQKNKEFLKSKIKSHGVEFTGFYDKKIPKVDSNHASLVIRKIKSENYLRVFLKQCKYIQKKQLEILIINNYDNFCDFSSSDEFDDSNEEQIKDIRLIF